MDNVLIDDRRIHVDFSQSVSKIKWKGKGVCVWHKSQCLIIRQNKGGVASVHDSDGVFG